MLGFVDDIANLAEKEEEFRNALKAVDTLVEEKFWLNINKCKTVVM